LSRGRESVALSESPGVEAVLRRIGKSVRTNPRAVDLTSFVLALGRLWKERGGTVAGKLRHSDRHLNELLKQQGTIVKSLTPKLAGKTKLKRDDASALLRLFLSHWNYVSSSESGIQSEAYNGISNTEFEEVYRHIEDRFSEGEENGKVELDSPEPPSKASIDTAKLIPDQFKDADALFTISTEQTLIVPSRPLVGFKDLLNALFAIDSADDRERILVWILDLGAQDFADPQASSRFLNVEALASRFRALKVFQEQIAEARWNWLQSRAFFVLHNPRVSGHQFAELPAFTTHHFLFDGVPISWAKSSEFRTLYGNQLERLDERIYTIFLDKFAGDTSGRGNLRYFGHAQVMSDGKDERQVQGLQLPPPGHDYEIAFGTVYAAATYALHIDANLTKLSIDGKQATGALGRLGFSLLGLDDFMNGRYGQNFSSEDS
jgi:hypothetical protein